MMILADRTRSDRTRYIFLLVAALAFAASFSAVADDPEIGETTVPSLEPDEPGVVVWGEGQDIHGQAHLTDVRYSGGSFWAQGAPTRLATWLNAQTGLRVRLLSDSNAVDLSHSPTRNATDPAEVEGIFTQPLLLMSHTDAEFTFGSEEVRTLRSYLARGGLLFVDDDAGLTGSFQKRVLSGVRIALPETPIKPEPIPPDHPIYHCFYEMEGPPTGSQKWRQREASDGHALEGVLIGDRLAVLLSDRGYWEALTTEGPERPEVLRFATNLLVYAVTHGYIVDHSRYQR